MRGRLLTLLLAVFVLCNSTVVPAQAAVRTAGTADRSSVVAPLPSSNRQVQNVPESNPPPQPQVTPAHEPAAASIPSHQQPPVGVGLVLLPSSAPSGYDYIWHYQDGVWSKTRPPLAGQSWRWIAADPTDPQRWLLLIQPIYGTFYNISGSVRTYYGDQALWLTRDAGVTWQAVDVTASGSSIDIARVEFDPYRPGSWQITGHIDNHPTDDTAIWRGTLDHQESFTALPSPVYCYHELSSFAPGIHGETILYGLSGTSCGSAWQRRGIAYVAPEDTTINVAGSLLVGNGVYAPPILSYLERLPGTSPAVVAADPVSSSLYATTDYHSVQVTPQITGTIQGNFVTAAQDAVFALGTSTGVLQIDDALGSPTVTTVAGASDIMSYVRADRQTRTVVAAMSYNREHLYVRPGLGESWTSVGYPPDIYTGYLGTKLEVLPGRGAFPADQMRCPECLASQHVHAVVGGPIDTRTGNLWTTGLDLAVTTPGPALSWERSYASQATATADASLGYGWTHTYASRLITETMTGGEVGRVIVVSPKGNRWRYDDLGGGYRPWPGVPGTLIRAGDAYTQTLANNQLLVFEAGSGRLRAVRDPLGRTLQLTYDGTSGLLTHIEDSGDSSRFLDISYDSNSRIASVEDPAGRSVSYTYSSAGDLETVSDVMQRVTTYHYQSHLLTEMLNALNQTIEQTTYDTYTPSGRAIEQTLQHGQQIELDYQSTATVVTTSGPDGQEQVTTYAYGSDDVLTDVSIAGETVMATAAERSFMPGATSDGNGNVTTATYSSLGLPQSQTNALGQTTRASYDAQNRPLSVVDWQGVQSRWRYDSQGNVISSTVGMTTSIPLGYTTLYTYTYDVRYTGDSQLTEQAGPDGVRTRYAYDAQGQVISSTIGYGTTLAQTTGYGYDAQGWVVTTTVGLGTALARQDVTHYNLDNTVDETIQNYQDGIFDANTPDQDVTTSFGYDDLGRQIWMRDVLGHYQVTRYTDTGLVEATARNVVPFQSDTAGQPIIPSFDAAAPDQNVATTYGYDGLGRTTLVTETGILTGTFDPVTLTFSDATTRVTRTEYDAFSRPVTVTLNYHPGLPSTVDTNVQTLTYYDGAGNVIWQRDAYGRWTRTEYDELNRPTRTIQNYEDGDPLTGARDADLVQETEYDVAGRLERQIENAVDSVFSVTEPITDRVTLTEYDAISRPITTTLNLAVGQSDPALNRISLSAYDTSSGRVQGTRDALGRWISQQYDVLGRISATVQNCRDGSGTAVATGCATFSSSTPDRNVTSETHYDALGRAFERLDPAGVATRSLYDGLGRVTSTIAAYDDGVFDSNVPDTDVTTQTSYNALGQAVTATDPTSGVTTQAYNGLGATIVITDSVGRETHQGYDGQGALRWSRSPDGRLTVYQLDGLGRTIATIANYDDGVVGVSEPADQDLITETVYDAAGRQVQTVNPAGQVTQFAYDNLDRLVAVTENVATGTCALAPCDIVTQYQYDRAGNRTAMIDANGHIRRFNYDAANQQVEAIDALNQTTGYDYDAGGRLVSTNDPRGSNDNLTYGYDGLDRQISISASNLGTISQSYDARGRRTSLVDATGTTSFQYDQLGRMTQVSAPNTGTVGYGYDAAGMRTSLTYPDSTAITYVYAADHQLHTVQQGSEHLASYTYDNAGRLAQVARSNGTTTTQGYDGADRINSLVTTRGENLVSSYEYSIDRDGLRTQVDERTALGGSATQLKAITFEDGSLTHAWSGADTTVGTVNLEAGPPAGSGAPIDGAYAARIDSAGSYIQEDISGQDVLFVTFSFRLDSNPWSSSTILEVYNGSTLVGTLLILRSGGLFGSNSLYLGRNNQKIGGGIALTGGRTYRVAIEQRKGTSATGVLRAYIATGANAFGAPFAQSTTEDITTQATQVRVGATQSTALDMVVDDVVLDSGSLPASSATLEGRTVTYSYDGLQRLTGATEAATAPLTATTTYTYTYDDAGNRTGVWTDGTQTQNLSYNAANQVTGWTYDAAGNLLSDGTSSYSYDALGRVTTLNSASNSYNGDGVLVVQTVGITTTNYSQDLAAPLSQILHDGTNQYVYGNGSERLYGAAGSTRTWYSDDALGSVRVTINQSGVVQASADYDPWGVLETSSIASFGFTGELQQGNSVYLRARWYAAGQGSFVSRDPFAGMSERPYSLQYYQYGYANPVSNTDPSGNVVEPPDDVVSRCDAASRAIGMARRIRQGKWNEDEEQLTKCLAPIITKYAGAHSLPEFGFDANTLAATMAAIIQMENGNTTFDDFKNRMAGNAYNRSGLGGKVDNRRETSTGIANMKPSTVMEIYMCEIPWSDPSGKSGVMNSGFQTNYVTHKQMDEWLQHPNRNQYGVDMRGKFADGDIGWVSQLLQDNEFAIEMLAVNIKRGVFRAKALGLQPSVFNIASWHRGGIQHPEFILKDDAVRGYAAYVSNGLLDRAAKNLGISLRPDVHRWNKSRDLHQDEFVFVKDCLSKGCSP
jgi:RHS repeat-associated protein